MVILSLMDGTVIVLLFYSNVVDYTPVSLWHNLHSSLARFVNMSTNTLFKKMEKL